MYITKDFKGKILLGDFDETFQRLYGRRAVLQARQRYVDAVNEFERVFDQHRTVRVFSAPGRSELGGNHTDHQQGHVLAAAVELDILAMASENGEQVVRIKSDDLPMITVNIDELWMHDGEEGTSEALVRGIAARFRQLGYQIGGFNATMTSQVLKGSGLSSSAAFEVLVGEIFNGMFNGGKVSSVELAKIGQFSENHFFKKACGLMDQMASAVGGCVALDFADPEQVKIEKIPCDLAALGYRLCIVDTKGDHADLTPDYVAVREEMQQVAAFFGKEVLRQVEPREFFQNMGQLRRTVSDRAILRAMHFFHDDVWAQQEAVALRQKDIGTFLELVKKSGQSSISCLQNIYSSAHPASQGIMLGLMMSEKILGDQGAWRVHGGGFAGTMQCYVPLDQVETYCETMNKVFGEGSCYVLDIRNIGALEILEQIKEEGE